MKGMNDMGTQNLTHGVVFAVSLLALIAAHQLADHWVQTQRQANRKGLPGWPGRRACAAHVATYTITAAVALAAAATVLHLPLPLDQVALGLTVSAVTHYAADRRTPLRRLALALGKDPAWLDNRGGLYALDQSLHVTCLFIAALTIAA
jgi:hypothetical protein